MFMPIDRTIEQVTLDSRGVLHRRSFLQTMGVGLAAAPLGFADLLKASAPDLNKKQKSVIVLWMQGGPTQFETFDPKSGTDGCMTKTIQTAVPGIQISDYWPNVAKQMGDIALIRSMTNKEGNHQRATYQLHTGYQPSGTLKHPGFGAIVASEIAPKEYELPSFVSILGPSQSAGYLPASYAPFRVATPNQMPQNSESQVSADRFKRRLDLAGRLERNYAQQGASQQVNDHRMTYEQAARMVLSPKLKAFDINQETAAMKESYGTSAFGQGCLLARRLVEQGVTFVEIQLGNWDTHDDNANRAKNLSTNAIWRLPN